jgi:hypothetical protein
MLTVSSTACGQLVHTVRNDLTDKVLRASVAYGPDEQHQFPKKPLDVKDIQRFARVHGLHKEQPPQKSLALSTSLDQLDLPEDDSHISSRVPMIRGQVLADSWITSWMDQVPFPHVDTWKTSTL